MGCGRTNYSRINITSKTVVMEIMFVIDCLNYRRSLSFIHLHIMRGVRFYKTLTGPDVVHKPKKGPKWKLYVAG